MKYLITIVLVLLASAAVGQVTEEWVARYNGPGNGWDAAYAFAVDAEGNVYVTGYSCSSGFRDCDYATIKYDSDGNQLWAARYNGPGNGYDRANALAVDAEGNVHVTGFSEAPGTSRDYTTIKYDPNGNQLWVARYNGPGNGWDEAFALAVDADGNVHVTGCSWSAGIDYDYATIKYDSSGNQLWVARYNGLGNDDDKAFALALDADGNVYVTGESTGYWTCSDFATIKYRKNGTRHWVARYNGPANTTDFAKDLALDSSGNVYVTGRSTGSDTEYDYTSIKYDPYGNELWVARYNGPGNAWDGAEALATGLDGNIYVTGFSEGYDTFWDYATIKYDSLGNQLWVVRYNGLGNSYDWAEALDVDREGNLYVTGYSGGSGTGSDYATVKYNTRGSQLWVARYNGPENYEDAARSVAVDAEGNVYVTGTSSVSDTTSDYATIKYSQLTAVETATSGRTLPTGFDLTCQPNPFNASTTIMYSLPEAGDVSLNIYNLGGQLIETLVRDLQEPGEYRVIWDASNYSSAIYFYKLTAGDWTETRRTTLLK